MPIIKRGAVSPRAWAIPMMVPVNMPGIASGKTWCVMVCIFDAPTPRAASRMLGGTARIEAREEIMMVGNVIKAKTMPPTNGIDRGIPNITINIASPMIPKTTDGTAARLLILISIISVKRFFGAISSR